MTSTTTSAPMRISKHITVILEDMDEPTQREFTDAFAAEGLTGYVEPPAKQPRFVKHAK